ncbi:hypothetical protein FRC09_018882 [Ceratobasidium sp. 395]|nr:hypothetical protein FRC09_018882 [Ceratobasidium sp. 395]
MNLSTSHTSSPEPPSLPSICNVCGLSGLFLCSSCQYVWYCSTRCQEFDRPAHSELCPLLSGQLSDSAFRRVEHPGALVHGPVPLEVQHVRAFVLPANRSMHYDPLIELHANLGPTGEMRWVPRLETLLKANVPYTSAIISKGAGGQVLRFPLQIFFQTQPDAVPQMEMNQCVRAIAEGAPRLWQGNLIVLKFNGARRRGYKDIEDSDLPSIRHFLTHYQ